MSHQIVSREEWIAARKELLKEEKEFTRRSDELARRRQELPWVKIEKDYRFETDAGCTALADLFQGSSQLLVYHFMFGPEYHAGCPSCSAIADGFNGIAIHLANHDVMLWAVSRAPLAKLQAYKQRMGWTFPWASSVDGDFNADFAVSITEEQLRQGGSEYNYRPTNAWKGGGGGSAACAAMSGTDPATYARERPGMTRLCAGGWRGLPRLFRLRARIGWSLGYVPVARPRAQGRNETGVWWRLHDEYEAKPNNAGSCCHESKAQL